MNRVVAILIIIGLLVWGSLLITSTAYAFQFTDSVESSLTDEQRTKFHWTRFGAVLIGITGAAVILRAIWMIVLLVSGRDQDGDLWL